MHHLNSTTSRAPSPRIYCYQFFSCQCEPFSAAQCYALFLFARQFERHSNVSSRAAQRWIRHFLKQPTQKLQKYFAETDNKTRGRRIDLELNFISFLPSVAFYAFSENGTFFVTFCRTFAQLNRSSRHRMPDSSSD